MRKLKLYDVYRGHPFRSGVVLVKAGVRGILQAKQTASYYSVSAPPVWTFIREQESGELVARYHNGNLVREVAK